MSKAWTNDEIDKLLEWFLVHRRSYHAIKNELSRSFNSIDTKLRKLAMAYGASDRLYVPTKRTARANQPWSLRDRYLYKQWIKNGKPGGYSHLSRLLMRPIENIKRHTIPNYSRGGFDL